MRAVSDLDTLRQYLDATGIPRLGWFGQRASDFRGLEGYIDQTGVISCYGTSDNAGNVPVLSAQQATSRRKQSVDTLLESFGDEQLVSEFLSRNGVSTILPYDTTVQLERMCASKAIACLSAPDSLKMRLGDKTLIADISHQIGIDAIPGIAGVIDDFEYDPLASEYGLPLFLHFAVGAGGSGNYIVNSSQEFDAVREKRRGERLAVNEYITGRSCSIDICVTPSNVICDPLEEMLIGAEPLNSNPTEYVGSSWYHNNYSLETRKRILEIGVSLGRYLRSRGFLGFFHPDFLVTEKHIYITELNMRFGGSCGPWTRIQAKRQRVPLMLMAALAFLRPEMPIDEDTLNLQSLDSCDYSLLLLKNNESEVFEIDRNFRPGVYAFDGTNVSFIKNGLDSMPGPSELLINTLTSRGPMSVAPGALIAEIIGRLPVSDSFSKLNENGKRLVAAIRSSLRSQSR